MDTYLIHNTCAVAQWRVAWTRFLCPGLKDGDYIAADKEIYWRDRMTHHSHSSHTSLIEMAV
jgi:hypothetical protein